MAEWNPRYVAWATSQGRTPEEQHARERGDDSVSTLSAFSRWILERWDEWRALRGLKPRGIDRDYLTPEQHADFDAWVQTRAVELAGATREEATA